MQAYFYVHQLNMSLIYQGAHLYLALLKQQWLTSDILVLIFLLFHVAFRQMLGNKWLNYMIKESCQQ